MDQHKVSRRNFLKSSALTAASLTALSGAASNIFAAGSDRVRIGIIGCGDRGTGAALDAVAAAPNAEIVVRGDLFPDRLERMTQEFIKKNRQDKLKVTPETSFIGFDAYQKVLASDIDYVILAAPPGFRPLHFEAAVKADKHVFMEKPAAVDPVGIRKVLAAAAEAERKKLRVVAGTQRRHQKHYQELMERIHNGELGELVGGECYWCGEELWLRPRTPQMSDMEWQIRNWFYYTWLSGDHIVEQHVHNIDVMNWAFGTHPVKAFGMGGRQSRTQPEFGHIFDHFACEFEYPNGARVLSMCRQVNKANTRVSERIVGIGGVAISDSGSCNINIRGKKVFEDKDPANPYVTEHADLIESICGGQYINEGKQVAESTMTAILGRMSAYTGKEINWDWAMERSQLDLTPPRYDLGELPVPPVAIPGKTELL